MKSFDELIKKIKEKKELSGINDLLIRESLEKYLKKNKILLENANIKDIKIIVKEIREILRKLSGRFQKSLKDRYDFLENSQIDELLMSHRSTAERINFYPKLKEIIGSLNVHSILDLGSGLNPIALAKKDIFYYAVDINGDDLMIVESYFKRNNIMGKTINEDIRKIVHFPKVDLCLIFKVLDIIEKGHKTARSIIEKLEVKYLIISFAKKTLSGRKMRYPRRKWIENILNKLNYKYEIFSSENELFYLAAK